MAEIVTLTRALKPRFMELWVEFLKEQRDLGSSILANYQNQLAFGGLVDSYLRGSLFGFGLMSLDPDPCGCLLIGESPTGGFLETAWGRSATLWGVYVEPAYRQRGLAHQLQDAGFGPIKEMGFQTVVSDVLLGAKAAEANSWNWGRAHPHTTILYVDLRS